MPRIVWTQQALEDLRAIRDYIARDAPRTANAYVRRLIDAADLLEQHPHLGAIVAELQQPEVRELVRGNFRLIYRVRKSRVSMLAVYHAARLLDENRFSD